MAAPRASRRRSAPLEGFPTRRPATAVDCTRKTVADSLLRGLWQDRSKVRLSAGPSWTGNELGLVFTNRVGGPVDPSGLRRAVKQIAKAAGIEKNVVPYDFRRTNVSILYSEDVDPIRAADVHGHDPKTSLGDYRRRMEPVVDAHVDPINNVFGTGG